MQETDIGVATEYLGIIFDEVVIQEAHEFVADGTSYSAENAFDLQRISTMFPVKGNSKKDGTLFGCPNTTKSRRGNKERGWLRQGPRR
jgi:hypothetical protein